MDTVLMKHHRVALNQGKISQQQDRGSSLQEGDVGIEKKVNKALDKATTEYRETFEKLAEYDKQQ